MDEYITKVTVLRDSLVATGESIKESKMILVTLAGLGDDYEAFVTAITARYDPYLTFSHLCELIMDQDIRLEKSRMMDIQVVNIAVNQSKSCSTSYSKSEIKCQICTKRGHNALECYNRLNTSKFPPTHGRTLSSQGPNGSNRGIVSAITNSSTPVTMWVPRYRGDVSHHDNFGEYSAPACVKW